MEMNCKKDKKASKKLYRRAAAYREQSMNNSKRKM